MTRCPLPDLPCRFEQLEPRVLLAADGLLAAQSPADISSVVNDNVAAEASAVSQANAAETDDQLTASQRAVLDDIARGGDGTDWTPLSAEQLDELRQKSDVFLDNYLALHQPDGLNVDIQWTDFNRTTLDRYDGLGDSATWSGHYLAAQALRYADTGDPRIIDEIHATLDKLDILSRVSGDDGFLARHAIPDAVLDAPGSPYADYYDSYNGTTEDPRLGVNAFQGVGDLADYVWLGGTARDTYDGVNFGLATAYHHVDDPAVRAKIAVIVERIADFRVSTFSIFFDNFSVTTLLRTAATINPGKYQSDYNFASSLTGTGSNVDQNFGNYFSNNLDFIRMYVLTLLETDPGLQAKWNTKLTNLWSDAADHLNPHFAAIYLAGTGDTNDARAVAVLEGMLADFPESPRFNVRRINSTRTDMEFVTIDGQLYAKYAMPIDDRPGSDFMWQRHPFKLDGGSTSAEEHPGIDVFLPYWMGRQIGAIAKPEAPLPYSEDFDDGRAGFFGRSAGTWQVTEANRYEGEAEVGSRAVSLLNLATPLPANLKIDTKLTLTQGVGGLWTNGLVVFDYEGPDDFKFAGAFAGRDEWRIGHYDGDAWVVDAVFSSGPVDANTDYDVGVLIEGTRVTLFVDGHGQLDHDFGQSLTDGQLGLATNNALAKYDDLSVIAAATLPFAEDFDDGHADRFNPVRGEWVFNEAGAYQSMPEPGDDAISVVQLAGPVPEVLDIDATIRGMDGGAGFVKNGALIFDYRGADDFKFAGAWFGADQWRIGHYDGGDWIVDVNNEASIDLDTDYGAELLIRNTTAILRIDGEVMVSHDFDTPLTGGRIGVGTKRSVTQFDDFQVTAAPPAAVAGRHIFYNGSAFDGDDDTANGDDDDAIAPSPESAADPALGKTALLPGQSATFASYTSYDRGINGVMVDIMNLADPAVLGAGGFVFRIGNDDAPEDWPEAPTPSEVTVRPGAGVDGSDRITITWPDLAIAKQWLQVTVLSTEATGLAVPDVHYWGNAIGETGDVPGNASVDTFDRAGVRDHTRGVFDPAEIEDPYDFNRDKAVDGFDMAVVRDHATSAFTALRLITVPSAAAAAIKAPSATMPAASAMAAVTTDTASIKASAAITAQRAVAQAIAGTVPPSHAFFSLTPDGLPRLSVPSGWRWWDQAELTDHIEGTPLLDLPH